MWFYKKIKVFVIKDKTDNAKTRPHRELSRFSNASRLPVIQIYSYRHTNTYTHTHSDRHRKSSFPSKVRCFCFMTVISIFFSSSIKGLCPVVANLVLHSSLLIAGLVMSVYRLQSVCLIISSIYAFHRLQMC